MTLEEGIKYHKEIAEAFRQEAERVRDLGEHISSPMQPYNEPVKRYRDYAKEVLSNFCPDCGMRMKRKEKKNESN